MIRLLTDEHVSWAVIDGLRARVPEVDLVRVQDVGLSATDDRIVLEWAATQGRVWVTSDRRTGVPYADERVARGEPMAGVLAFRKRLPTGRAIEELATVLLCGTEDDVIDRVIYLPM